MREDFGYKVKAVSDHKHKELMPDEVYKIFKDEYLNKCAPVDIPEAHYVQKQKWYYLCRYHSFSERCNRRSYSRGQRTS